MKIPTRLVLLTLLGPLCCVSCKQDPALVEKREKQKVEIARLKGEIALMEEKLKHIPPDVSKELVEAEKQAAEQAAEIERLDAEIDDLQTRKVVLQREFDAYRDKYKIKVK